MHFADGETGYDYLDESESLIPHFSYTLGNGSGLTDSATVDLTIAGAGESESESESPAGQSMIDLGDYGQLLAPVNVDGKWYYVWDMNGDGSHDFNQDASGQWDYDGAVVNGAGSGFQYGFASHDVLDGLFTQDIDGNANPGSDTSDIFRFATLNGVHLALPTYGGSGVVPDSWFYANGTAIDNNPVGEINPAYDDLLAIWDAFNGSGTGLGMYDTPPGWQAYSYGSASPAAYGHAGVHLVDGIVFDSDDYGDTYVAVEVL